MDGIVVKVERKLFPHGQPAHVFNRYKSTDLTMHLPDNARFQMGGERVAFFRADCSGKKPVFFDRVPNEDW